MSLRELLLSDLAGWVQSGSVEYHVFPYLGAGRGFQLITLRRSGGGWSKKFYDFRSVEELESKFPAVPTRGWVAK